MGWPWAGRAGRTAGGRARGRQRTGHRRAPGAATGTCTPTRCSGSPVIALAGEQLLLGGVLSCTMLNLRSIHLGQTAEAHTHALSTSGFGFAGIITGHLIE